MTTPTPDEIRFACDCLADDRIMGTEHAAELCRLALRGLKAEGLVEKLRTNLSHDAACSLCVRTKDVVAEALSAYEADHV